MALRFTAPLACLTTLAASFALSVAVAAEPSEPAASGAAATTVRGPSGLPLPRFVALRKDRVLARFGPSFEYPVAYEFSQEGLPLKVIEEDRDNIWRRVEDRDGRRMWIHRSMLSANESAVVTTDLAVLRAEPSASAAGRARLTKGVMTRLEDCNAEWCRVRTDEFRGWVPRETLWGAPL